MSLEYDLGFQSLLKPLKSVGKHLDSLDTRDKSRIAFSISDVVLSNFAMMFFQDASMLQFQKKMQDQYQGSNLQNIFGVKKLPSDSTMRTILDQIDTNEFASVIPNIINKLAVSKQLGRFASLYGKYVCALDGSQYHSSKNVHCRYCLKKTHRNGTETYSHQVLVPAIVNPKLKEILPLMPEEIRNEDGATKQDCEINAAKRLIPKLKQYGLPLILTGDALFACQSIVELALGNGFSYILTIKHEAFLERVAQRDDLRTKIITRGDEQYIYAWVNEASLNFNKETVFVNYFSLKIINMKTEKITYRNTWITDLTVEEATVETFVEAGRSRWKIENECFNVLKNNGYEMEHNYGHGEKHLAANYFLFTLLAHLFHQIQQLVDEVYQKLRIKKGSLVVFWSDLRAAIKLILFDSWEQLINYLLNPPPGIHASQLLQQV